MQDLDPVKSGSEQKKLPEVTEAADLPYFCLACRKTKGCSAPVQKKPPSKSKAKKSVAKGSIKRSQS